MYCTVQGVSEASALHKRKTVGSFQHALHVELSVLILCKYSKLECSPSHTFVSNISVCARYHLIYVSYCLMPV